MGAGPRFRHELPFYGFEHVDLCTTHGDQVGGHYYVWLKSRRADADALRDHKNQLPHDYVCPQAFRTPIPEELYPTSYIAEQKLRMARPLCRRGDRDKPFFLMTSFPDPHHPFTPPGRYWSMYRPQDMALPPSFRSRQPAAGAASAAWALRAARRAAPRDVRAGRLRGRRARGARGDGAELRHDRDDRRRRRPILRRARGTRPRRGYRGDLHHRPRRLSRRSPADAEGPGAFRVITHVPFIWAEPGAPARTSDALAGTLDIAATVLDRARIQPYNGIQGESPLPAIAGGTLPTTRDAMVIEDDQQRAVLGFETPTEAAHAGDPAVAADHRGWRSVGRALRPRQ